MAYGISSVCICMHLYVLERALESCESSRYVIQCLWTEERTDY